MTIARDPETGTILGQVINEPGLNPTTTVRILCKGGKVIELPLNQVRLEAV